MENCRRDNILNKHETVILNDWICCKSGFFANTGLCMLDAVSLSRCLLRQKTSFICFCVWNNLPSSFNSLPSSIQTPTCLLVSLPLRVREKSIFRKYKECSFFSFFHFFHLPPSLGAFFGGKGASLNGPFSSERFCSPLFSHFLSCVFYWKDLWWREGVE